MNIDELKQEMINRKYQLIVDQDFIDAYYIVFDIYKEHDNVVMDMWNALKPNVSDHIKNYNLDNIKYTCYFILEDRKIENGVVNSMYDEFVDWILPYYKKKYAINKNKTHSSQIVIDDNKKYYVIELTFDEIVTINTIVGSIGGFLRTSRKYFHDNNGILMIKTLFGAQGFFSSGSCAIIYFEKDVLGYIKASHDHHSW